MRNLQAEPPIANTGDDADVMAAARARLTQAADALMATDAARRLVDDIAEAMREDVLAAEQALQVFASLFARAIMVAPSSGSMTMASAWRWMAGPAAGQGCIGVPDRGRHWPDRRRHDAGGNMVQRVCLGRLPEAGKASLKAHPS